MATTRRDIELLISAKETTGRSFSQVTSNIDALNTKIAEQIIQAERGEISLQELRKTQEALAQAGRDLSSIQGQIDAYQRLQASEQKVGEAAEVAKAKLDAFRAQIEAAGKSTTSQENKMQRLENAVVRTSAAVEKNRADLIAQATVLERAGVATTSLDQAQAGVVNSARQVGAGLVQVNAAVQDYSVNAAAASERAANARREASEETTAATARERAAVRAATEEAKLSGAERRNEAARDAQDQAERAARIVSSIELIRDAEQRLAQQAGFDKKISDAQRLGDASKFVQLFADSVQTVAIAENQLSALTGFRAVGQQAAEASRDISQFVQSGQSLAISSQQVAAGLRAIIDPGSAALKTLSGVEAAIQQADTTAGEGVKNVGLLNDAYNQLAAASSALVQQGGLVDSFRQQATATDTARQQLQAAQADVQRFGAAMAAADRPTDALVQSLREAEARLQATGRALAQEETKLGLLSRELRNAGINTADLATEQTRLEAAATQVGATMERVNTVLGRGGRQTNGLFGLKPNDLNNLGFQLNDIFVSLASGQKPLTVFIQQGAQISQIFPGLLSTLARFALAWSPILIPITLVGLAIREITTDASRLKTAMADLAILPTGEGLNPAQYAAVQEKLEGMGVSAEDARAAMRLLVEEGFDVAAIETYSVAAEQLSKRLGVDLAEATQLLVDVQQGGIEAVLDLAEKTNDLTQADLDHAEALFEAGRAGEARQFVLDRVAERNEQIAAATRSSWTPAVNNLKAAFNSFAGFLQSVFQPVLDAINDKINNTIVGFTFLTGLLAGKGVDGARASAFEAIRQQRSRGQAAPVARGATDQQIRDRRFSSELDTEVDDGKELTNQERLRKVAVEARTRAQAAGVSKSLEDRAVQQAIAAEQRDINKEGEKAAKKGASAANKAEAARKRAERAAATAQRQRETAQRQLEAQLRQLNRQAFTGASSTLEERLEAINEKYETIADSIKKVRALGITTDGDGVDLGAVEKQVEATKQRLKDEETIKFFQEQAALLEKQRSAELERISDARERGALTTQAAMEAAAEVTGRLSPQIVNAANQALTVARALAGTNPSPEMVSWIASLERIVAGEATDRSVADIGLAGFEEASSRLNTLISERDELVRSYQTLFELGLRTEGEVRELTTQAYSQQAAAIQPVLDQLREQAALLNATIDPLTKLPVLTDTAYTAWLAKIQAVQAGLQNVDARVASVNQAAMQGIQQGVTGAFNIMAQAVVQAGSALAGLEGATFSWGDALGAVIQTGLTLLGSFLEAIAQVLVQMVALQVAKALIGGSTGGLGALFFHDGGVVGKQGGSRKRQIGGGGSWLGAPKFHGGGGMGLRPDEYKAVLQRGEEVLTEDDPRHVRNLGSGGGSAPAPSLKQVLLLDPEAVPNAMQSRSGQKAMLTVIRQNKETIKQVLG